ncbi:MAG: class I lanthipeptide [Acidobacteriota bacterium]|nr:class I lanthipeptide [Acidobacteriota bacterium]
MKKKQKKMVLDRETVRRLDAAALGAVEGGYNYSTGIICHTHVCSTKPSC